MGERVEVRYTKWGGRPHWAFEATRLGEDEHGTWLSVPAGTRHTRPGHEFRPRVDNVVLLTPDVPATPIFPRPGPAEGRPRFDVYVDMATPPVWDGDTVTMVDLDLDVILRLDGEVEVLDEDELELHSRLYDYPPEVVELARRSCADVVAALTERREPYGTVGWSWLPPVSRPPGRPTTRRGR